MASRDTTSKLTLLELARRMAPDKNTIAIAEVLNLTNEMLDDAPWIEANGVTYHKIVRRGSLPAGTWRLLNDGVPTEASQTIEVNEPVGMLESLAVVDVDLVKLAPNPKEFRNSEAMAFVEGLGQTMASTIIYGDTGTTPEKFDGFAKRLNATARPNVYSNGASGSTLTSIFIIQWGANKVHMIYPRGSANMGIQHTDMGIELVTGITANTQFRAYRDHFQIKAGLAVRDERCIVRICNIASSGTTNTFDEDNLITALNEMPNRGAGAVIYCNSTIFTQIDIKAKDKANVQYGPADAWGRPATYFRGFPLKRVDAITNTESTIS